MLGNSSAQWRRLDSMTQGRIDTRCSWRITFGMFGIAVVEIAYPTFGQVGSPEYLQTKYVVDAQGFLERYPGFDGFDRPLWEYRC